VRSGIKSAPEGGFRATSRVCAPSRSSRAGLHAGIPFSPGYVGVDVFFVISDS